MKAKYGMPFNFTLRNEEKMSTELKKPIIAKISLEYRVPKKIQKTIQKILEYLQISGQDFINRLISREINFWKDELEKEFDEQTIKLLKHLGFELPG